MRAKNALKIIIVFLILIGIFLAYKINQHRKLPANNLDSVASVAETIKPEPEKPKEIVLLGRAKVSFLGSSKERINNITIGLSRLDGKVIPAGTEFSFHKNFGQVNESDGFEEAYAFINGEIVPSIGSGVCQVSTTLFQSALEAGLPITDRTNHVFYVGYYKTGLDATVSENGPDLKFLNDTGNDITIKGYVEDTSAVFELYGVYDKRMATLSKADIFDYISPPPTKYIEIPNAPKDYKYCDHASQAGYSTKVSYNVVYPDGTTKETIFNSKYKPITKTCYISDDAK